MDKVQINLEIYALVSSVENHLFFTSPPSPLPVHTKTPDGAGGIFASPSKSSVFWLIDVQDHDTIPHYNSVLCVCYVLRVTCYTIA